MKHIFIFLILVVITFNGSRSESNDENSLYDLLFVVLPQANLGAIEDYYQYLVQQDFYTIGYYNMVTQVTSYFISDYLPLENGLSPNGEYMIVMKKKGEICQLNRAWDEMYCLPFADIPPNSQGYIRYSLYGIEWYPDSQRVVIGQAIKLDNITEVPSGEILANWQGHNLVVDATNGHILSSTLSQNPPSSVQVIYPVRWIDNFALVKPTGLTYQQIKIAALPDFEIIREFSIHPYDIIDTTLSPDGSKIAIRDEITPITIVDIEGNLITTIQAQGTWNGLLGPMAWSDDVQTLFWIGGLVTPDETSRAPGFSDGAFFYDLMTMQLKQGSHKLTEARYLKWSPNKNYFLVVNEDGSHAILNLETDLSFEFITGDESINSIMINWVPNGWLQIGNPTPTPTPTEPSTSCDFSPLNAAELVADISSANGTPQADTICLVENAIYTLTTTNNGLNGLPLISSEIVVEGNGATLTRDGATPHFRFFEVATTGNLTLNDLTMSNGNTTGNRSWGYKSGDNCRWEFWVKIESIFVQDSGCGVKWQWKSCCSWCLYG